ncbi:hypothetical protein [Streptomyces sp. SID13031]|uniref:hypothetical protein n=1 Tax=Streptomyces sp. SID13031 TaxID=2706046 RepID=UPI0013CD599D|nr:hypothetical protein [Streptomyces sp. SID13031]NEA36081.1 hypothetical protein [Streptomyces sp. SID13031]
MLRPLVAVTAAAVLLAGCSGGDDKKSDSPSEGDSKNSASTPTPTTPELPSFDPPKAFNAVAALPYARSEGSIGLDYAVAGMVGKAALYSNDTGMFGRLIDGSSTWQVPATDVKSTKVVDVLKPVGVQLDGKEVIATGYIQSVEAGGTQKAHAQVAFQWIDPVEGKLVSSVTVDLTPVIGPGSTVKRQMSYAYDTSTGQYVVSIGVSGASMSQPAKYDTVAVYADPATKKGVVIPAVEAAGVLNGTVVGATADKAKGMKGLSMVIADGSTGAIKKSIPTPTMTNLSVEGTGGKRAFISGSGYVQDTKYDHHYLNSMYAVDIASAEVVETKMPNTPEGIGFDCKSDHVTALVCSFSSIKGADGNDIDELGAFDDATGKRTWSYSEKTASRVVPEITAFYNGYLYGNAQSQPAVLDAKTGQDVPVPAATPGATPTDGGSPTPGGTTPTNDSGPTSGAPTDGPGSTTTGAGDPGTWGDTSLIYGDPRAPEAVSKYGSTYLLSGGGKAPVLTEKILVVQKATS